MVGANIGVGDRIVAAVAQEPFVSGGNDFCRLIPICTMEGKPLSAEEFPNKGLVWWRIMESDRDHAVPKNLVLVELEEAPAYSAVDQNKDFYQARSISRLKGVNEIIRVDQYRQTAELIRAGMVSLRRLVHGAVYFLTGEEVSGPWRVSLRDESSDPYVFDVQALQQERVWNWNWDEFVSLVNVITREARFETDRRWGDYELESYTLVFYDHLKTAFEKAVNLEALSDRDIVSRVARASVTHAERRELERFFENALKDIEEGDLAPYRPRIETYLARVRGFEQELRPLYDSILKQEHMKTALEKRQSELAEEYVRQRTGELEAKARQEIDALLAERDETAQKIEASRNAYEEERRRQEAELEKERRKHEMEMARKHEKETARSRETIAALEKAADNFKEKREEILQNMLSILPLIQEMRAPSIAGAPSAAAVQQERAPKRSAFEFPPYVLEGAPDNPMDEAHFIEMWLKNVRDTGYSYVESDLLNYHIAMKSERFNILAGPSGVGKSTLPRLYSLALHGYAGSQSPDRYLMVPVRPGWMDMRDLLGYFNSLEGVFEPAPARLFETLVFACEEERMGHSGVYVINLDEINLSYVEHYFADFLSALQNPEGAQGVRCFNPDLCAEGDPLRPYGYLSIARSVRFTGTANVDETTKPFSPRMLDRVNVIEIQPPPQPIFEGQETAPLGSSYLERKNAAPISASVYRSWTASRPSEETISFVRRSIDPIQKILYQYGYPLSMRALGGIARYAANSADLISEREAFDRQILQRVLPKLRGHTDRFRQLLQELLGELPEEFYPRSHKRLSRMMESEYAMDFFHCIQEA
ncbi:MAG: hypothetical protein OXT69_08190 [Candidatus Poribacteria bacterium]|nr:hypothetical protein [Candidatus Poribacteria bacterium]